MNNIICFDKINFPYCEVVKRCEFLLYYKDILYLSNSIITLLKDFVNFIFIKKNILIIKNENVKFEKRGSFWKKFNVNKKYLLIKN